MLEAMMIKNLDKYQEKLKILEYCKTPYFENLILKNYGLAVKNHNNHLVFCVRHDWLNITPTEPNDVFKNILRNR